MLLTNLTKMLLNELIHFSILGMKWGVRRTPEQLDHLNKQNAEWVKKKSDKITKESRKRTSGELSRYANELLKDSNAVNKNDKLSSSTINAYNKRMASLMNKQVANIRSPSGKVVRYVAKHGEVGVHMALADQGYNMDKLKNGIWRSGRVAYKKETVNMAREEDY